MKYRLTAPHYIEDRVYDAGAEVGDGCECTFRRDDGTPHPPSTEMIALDEEGAIAISARFGNNAPELPDPLVPRPIQGSHDTNKVAVAPQRPLGHPVQTPVHTAPVKAPMTGINKGDPLRENVK